MPRVNSKKYKLTAYYMAHSVPSTGDILGTKTIIALRACGLLMCVSRHSRFERQVYQEVTGSELDTEKLSGTKQFMAQGKTGFRLCEQKHHTVIKQQTKAT